MENENLQKRPKRKQKIWNRKKKSRNLSPHLLNFYIYVLYSLADRPTDQNSYNRLSLIRWIITKKSDFYLRKLQRNRLFFIFLQFYKIIWYNCFLRCNRRADWFSFESRRELAEQSEQCQPSIKSHYLHTQNWTVSKI